MPDSAAAAPTQATTYASASFELVDPWGPEERRVSAAKAREEPPADIVIVDPWSGTERPVSTRLESIELVDPWQDDERRTIPTKAFPLIEPSEMRGTPR